jgi:hypothetical protein
LAVGAGLWFEHRLWAATTTIGGAFDGLRERPADGKDGTHDFLVVLTLPPADTSDAPGPESGTSEHWWRGQEQAVLLVHLDASVSEPVVVGLPAELADIAQDPNPAALVAAVEDQTGVRIDHLVACDWSGLARLATEVGGAPVVPEATQQRVLLGGDELLAFVAGEDLPASVDREPVVVRRQLAVLRSLFDEALAQEMRKQPWRAYGLVHTIAQHMAVDDRWSRSELRGIAWSVRGLRSAWIDYLVAPDASAEREELWAAIRDDDVAAWLDAHPVAELPDAVR